MQGESGQGAPASLTRPAVRRSVGLRLPGLPLRPAPEGGARDSCSDFRVKPWRSRAAIRAVLELLRPARFRRPRRQPRPGLLGARASAHLCGARAIAPGDKISTMHLCLPRTRPRRGALSELASVARTEARLDSPGPCGRPRRPPVPFPTCVASPRCRLALPALEGRGHGVVPWPRPGFSGGGRQDVCRLLSSSSLHPVNAQYFSGASQRDGNQAPRCSGPQPLPRGAARTELGSRPAEPPPPRPLSELSDKSLVNGSCQLRHWSPPGLLSDWTSARAIRQSQMTARHSKRFPCIGPLVLLTALWDGCCLISPFYRYINGGSAQAARLLKLYP